MRRHCGEKKGISQEELAAQLNTKGPEIGRYERDEMKPSIYAATKMAQLLEVSLDWLVGTTDVEWIPIPSTAYRILTN
jgi:ribosome-binding protein aMBF1 (putative translation factor)